MMSKTLFTCPVTNSQLVVSCGLEECKYHLNTDISKNCLLAYIDNQGVDQLSNEEISFLYKIPMATVQKHTTNALKILREGVVEAEAQTNDELSRQFNFIDTDKLCCVCSAPVVNKIRVTGLPLAYCSVDCQEFKHYLILKLEHTNGVDIGTILKWAFRKFKTISLIERSLNLPRWLVYEACTKYLNRDIREFFPTVKKTPNFSNNKPANLQRIVSQCVSKYGKPLLPTSSIQDSFQKILLESA